MRFNRLYFISLVFFVFSATLCYSDQPQALAGNNKGKKEKDAQKKTQIPSSKRSVKAIEKVRPKLEKDLEEKGLAYGSPIFIRIFKATSDLELWVRQHKGVFKLLKTYFICALSGMLGPKTKQGDGQGPEGFYIVKPEDLRPSNLFYLAFFINYPNRYDKIHKRKGGQIMIHGRCVSAGCYSMTNAQIEEIYALVDAAFRGGQKSIRIHIFPFRMTDENMESHQSSQWIDFWKNLKEGYDFFETKKIPPRVTVKNAVYEFKDDP
jgi:murein L,D-transpeptidase YafK